MIFLFTKNFFYMAIKFLVYIKQLLYTEKCFYMQKNILYKLQKTISYAE